MTQQGVNDCVLTHCARCHSRNNWSLELLACLLYFLHSLACMSAVLPAQPGCTADSGGQQHPVQLQLPAEHNQQCSCCQLCPLLWPVCNILQQLEGNTQPLVAIPSVAFHMSPMYCSTAVFTPNSRQGSARIMWLVMFSFAALPITNKSKLSPTSH